MVDDDIVKFDAVSGVTAIGSTYNDASFEDILFMVTSAPTATTITITMAAAEAGTQLSNSGSASALCYVTVGPAQEVGGYGWGTRQLGLELLQDQRPLLYQQLLQFPPAAVTTIVIADSTAFPTSGEIRIDSEDISFTANDTSTGTLSGGARNVNGTTLAGHSSGATVTNISDYVAWGEASSADFTIEPGLWVLDNYGTKLMALVYNGSCYEWDAAASNPTENRATVVSQEHQQLLETYDSVSG